MRYQILLVVMFVAAGLRAGIAPVDVVIFTDPTSNTTIFRSTIAVSGDTHLSLIGSDGVRIFQADIDADHFISKRLPCATLPTGRYNLILTNNRGRTTLPFTSQEGFIDYDYTDGSVILLPNFALADDRRLIVNYPPSDGFSVRVTLTNAAGQEVFTDQISATSRMRKAYQLERLSAGMYTLTVAADAERLHSQDLRLH